MEGRNVIYEHSKCLKTDWGRIRHAIHFAYHIAAFAAAFPYIKGKCPKPRSRINLLAANDRG
jgi:hypothetical protein